MKFPILKTGLIRWANDTKTHFGGEFSIYKWLKRALGYANVPYADPCCDLTPTQPVPMRFNPSSSTSEYFDVTTQTWVTLPSPCFAWSIYNDSGSTIVVDYVDCSGQADTQSVNDGDTATIAGRSLTDPATTGVLVTFIGLD